MARSGIDRRWMPLNALRVLTKAGEVLRPAAAGRRPLGLQMPPSFAVKWTQFARQATGKASAAVREHV